MARVTGFEPNNSGQQPIDSNGDPAGVGVWGDSDTGVGVFGTSGTLAPGDSDIPVAIAGVEGHGTAVPGVVGRSITDAGVTGESVQGLGMLGRGNSGTGVLGVTFNPSPGDASGVFGSSVAEGNGVTGFVGSQTGVVGSSVRGTGVRGTSTKIGVLGESAGGDRQNWPGVLGRSPRGAGVQGEGDGGAGVRGTSNTDHGMTGVTFGSASGSNGLHFSSQPGSGAAGTSVVGVGVDGFSFTGTGVRGASNSGLAGEFFGNIKVSGTVMKSGGGFVIDHPLDPDNRTLAHSFVESPDMLNVYVGTVTTDDSGAADVALPDYFEALNGDPHYQLTVVGDIAQAIVSSELRDNRFGIRTDRPHTKVCWQVTGVRRDAWAQANRIPVEERKEDAMSAQDQSNTRVAEARRRLLAALPDHLRDSSAAVVSAAHVDTAELDRLVAEAVRSTTGPEPTSAEQLERDWRRVESDIREMPRAS
ncbi:MAG: hypothetical protein ICV72_09305 [Aldersonia sp.]|nr:hypothetical protein [Aldersonia sp.]